MFSLTKDPLGSFLREAAIEINQKEGISKPKTSETLNSITEPTSVSLPEKQIK